MYKYRMSAAQKHIAASILFAAALISAALFLRDTRESAPETSGAVAVVRSAAERNVIPVEDQDRDGVPDWQEALQVTTPLELTGETDDTYTPPETITDQFALEFFQDIVRAENYAMFGDTPQELVASAANSLAVDTADTLLTEEDVLVNPDASVRAQAAYAEQVARIMQTYSEESAENEAEVLTRALRSQDEADLVSLDEKIDAYTNFLEETKALPVPENLVREHVNLLNAYQAALSNVTAMRNAFVDPMFTLMRMKRYEDDAAGLLLAISNLYTLVVSRGAQWDEGSPVYSVISINEEN